MPTGQKPLELRVHGRVLQHLGIQMYQSPVNAVAEMVANSWDADAENVSIQLPETVSADAEIVISDDGLGMTYEECQDRYLSVGLDRRGNNPDERSPEKQRPVLGRKGIGKFAGLGIARRITIRTVSRATGETTVFLLDVGALLGDAYIGEGQKPIPVLEHRPPDPQQCAHAGTTVTLSALTFERTPNADRFRASMARRFLLHESQASFAVLVNDEALPQSLELGKAQYVFPRDYGADDRPETLGPISDDGWGTERLPGGDTIRWRFIFHEDTVDSEELRGVVVFAKGKLVQRPFLFNLHGGLGGQHGAEYLTGQVSADYLDTLGHDVIAPERQRVRWDDSRAAPVIVWGQQRVKELLRLWQKRRGEERQREIEQMVVGFAERLGYLPASDAKVVKRALTRLAGIPQISKGQLAGVGDAVLTAWESGRLRDLMSEIAAAEDLSEADLLGLLLEANVLTALNVAEAVRTKLVTVAGLKARLESKELENAVRNYIANNPWLISPKWETYRVERSVKKLLDDAAADSGLEKYEGRIDLALASGDHLLVLEFMRPGEKLDRDHLERFDYYVRTIRAELRANTGGQFGRATGYMIADGLAKKSAITGRIEALANEDMYALSWETLLQGAVKQWDEFLVALVGRAPGDKRLSNLLPVASPDTKAGPA